MHKIIMTLMLASFVIWRKMLTLGENMAEYETLIPKGLEPFGDGNWWSVDRTEDLHAIFKFPQSTSDGVVTMFRAWRNEGGVDSSVFSMGVSAISRELLGSTVRYYANNRPTDTYRMISGSKDFPETPFSLLGAVMVNSDGSPLSHDVTLHVNILNGMTGDQSDGLAGVKVENDRGLFVNKKTLNPVVDCAGYLAFCVSRYVEKSLQDESFIDKFLEERVARLREICVKNSLQVEIVEGEVPRLRNDSAGKYTGISIKRGDKVFVEVRRPVVRDDNLSLHDIVAPDSERLLRGVKPYSGIKFPLEELIDIGGMKGPVTSLLDLSLDSRF